MTDRPQSQIPPSSGLDAYDEVMTNLNDHFRELENVHGFDAASPSKGPSAFVSRMYDRLAMLVSEDPEHIHGSQVFDNLRQSAIICDGRGLVLSANDGAMRHLGVFPGQVLGASGLELENGVPFERMLRAPSHTDRTEAGLRFWRFYTHDDASVGAIVTPLSSLQTEGKGAAQDRYLVVFLTTTWDDDVRELLVSQFGLTAAEADVSLSFATGISLKQLAAQRERSHATIRNQFHAALAKTGCAGQSDLLRLLLGLSHLFVQLAPQPEPRPNIAGRRVEIVRPNGRFMEVHLLGDLSGEPFICFGGLFGLPFTPAVDAVLKANKLMMVGVSKPGQGGTSPPIKGDTPLACLTRDLRALLASMEIPRCAFVARSSNARVMFQLMARMPDQISKAFVVNPLVPYPYLKHGKVQSKWAKSLITGSRVSPTLTAMILRAGYRIATRHGVADFLRRAYAGSRVDRALFDEPANVKSFEDGMQSALQQGYASLVGDTIQCFDDWGPEVCQALRPLTVLHGTYDPDIPIEAVRKFAVDFPDHIHLREIKDGGGLLNYTHANTLCALLRS